MRGRLVLLMPVVSMEEAYRALLCYGAGLRTPFLILDCWRFGVSTARSGSQKSGKKGIFAQRK